MKSLYKRLLILGLLGILALSLSGCFLRALAGNMADGEGEAVGRVGATSITADCSEVPEGFEDTELWECIYLIEFGDGGFEIVTDVELISNFGIFGLLIDPVILQIPEDANSLVGTFNDGTSLGNLEISVVDSFNVQPGVVVTAEDGHKFAILEFPPGTTYDQVQFDFDLFFRYPTVEPVSVKGMFAGRVDVNGETFYIPLLPCTTDFANAPEVTIPVASSPQNLLFQLVGFVSQNQDIGCDGQVYDFTGAGAGNPAIAIEKSPDNQTVSSGSDAVFEIRVENTGDVQLTGVAVADALTPDCDADLETLDPGEVISYQCTASGVTSDFVNVAIVSATPPGGPAGSVTDDDSASVTVIANQTPDCSATAPSTDVIWPPDHRFVPVSITGVSDPDGDAVSINIGGIWQDEPVDSTGDGSFVPDGKGVGTDTAHLRAERMGGSGQDQGNGRVYHVFFTANDGNGGACSGEVLVGVPHNMGQGKVPVDDGALYDSTEG